MVIIRTSGLQFIILERTRNGEFNVSGTVEPDVSFISNPANNQADPTDAGMAGMAELQMILIKAISTLIDSASLRTSGFA